MLFIAESLFKYLVGNTRVHSREEALGRRRYISVEKKVLNAINSIFWELLYIPEKVALFQNRIIFVVHLKLDAFKGDWYTQIRRCDALNAVLKRISGIK